MVIIKYKSLLIYKYIIRWNKSLKILVVVAHPDDETLGMGGTLKKLSKHHQIKVMFLADGISGRRKSGYQSIPKWDITETERKKMEKEKAVRKEHAKKALRVLGINKFSFWDVPSEELSQVPMLKVIKYVEKELSRDNYKVIFTHHYNDLSNDHKIAYEAAITAARPFQYTTVNAILSFEIPSATDWRKPYRFNPNFIVDISKEINAKLKASSMYRHELRKFPHPRSKEVIDATALRWGGLYGFSRAEAFEIVSSRANDLSKLSLFQ